MIQPILKALAASALAALCAAPALAQAPAQTAPASDVQSVQRPLKKVGVTLGSLGNPYFVALARGAEAAALQANPKAKVTVLSADYDLNKQFMHIDSFIVAGVDLILINAADARAIEPAVRKARKAGIVVVAVDVAAAGADATVQTDNTQAGELACGFIADRLKGRGNVIIQNGPPVSAVLDRVKGCKTVLARHPDIRILSDDQDAKGSREGGLNVMQLYLTRFPKVDAVFTINDPQAVGADLAARQLNRRGIVIASVDGAPDIEAALKADTLVQASASQDPWAIARTAVQLGVGMMNGQRPPNPTVLLPSTLVTRANVGQYKGWAAPR
ncbi:ABC-type transporter, periplasmic component: CUT2 family, fructose specific [Cupriavidus necator]|uniref:ABC transporter n=1 Tax=Cupriavidus necator (strain ATCC 17699 / DSM 428 / KCTC 22496 / NCIMB 10442 / H16 / Stanier 337) TaxID=381666 RepID=Q0K137_CUPNH|nr:ABC transporter [Cupriavidus necator H16]QQB78819.1 ABC transporter substrate-binding protein [Cupriavidus necator]CAJ96287.1 ABC-type transporter, periplasmic component: CUT2 family, fructose specific [Cupriavidus necator H16]